MEEEIKEVEVSSKTVDDSAPAADPATEANTPAAETLSTDVSDTVVKVETVVEAATENAAESKGEVKEVTPDSAETSKPENAVSEKTAESGGEAASAESTDTADSTESSVEEKAPEVLFKDLGLDPEVLKAVHESGYTSPTQIQRDSIPAILKGRDVIGASQTGTGKTAAFALPSLSKIEKKGKAQIVVLEPTRELAHQVAGQFEKYGKHTGMKVALLYGGVKYGEQTDALKEADIVVATPGRIIDHFYRGSMKFREVSILILDEVDRMLDMGFLPAVRKLVNLCPWEGRQTLLFSATMPPAIETFAKWCLIEPLKIEVARSKVASTIRHAFYPVAGEQRDALVLAILKDVDFESVMIFTRTRKEADTVTDILKRNGHPKVAAMHSDICQKDRTAALKGFKEGTYEVLVATDVAARGIDISTVTHVINYRVPENAEDYVHRIGRTGRASKEGDACTILTADELDYAAAVEALTMQKIERKKIDGFDYVYTALIDDNPGPPRRKRPPAKRRRR